MPSIARAILLAVQAASFLALTGISPATITALASPLSGPANASPSSLAARYLSKRIDAELVPRASTTHLPAASAPPQQSRPANSSASFQQLSRSRDGMRADANNMQRIAKLAKHPRARSTQHQAPDLQQQSVSCLRSYQSNLCAFQAALTGLDKGEACLDEKDAYEELLKGVVNANKELLEATVMITDAIPVLGPVLGPILYDIKCLVIELLDAVENLVDCLVNITLQFLNQLLPALSPLLCALGLCL
ncbi:hypothetical protein DFH06DRAFT_1108173 [Mycena polygramma]|nr:hypothetical protein DFH06DRAFT_1108173 [Mycena polygramma]